MEFRFMADVRPLRGLRYAQDRVSNLARVVTPPYDIITPEAQARYYERDPYNIIRLELGKTTDHDNDLDNVYTRAAAYLSEWRNQGVLHMEEQPCYYLYQQLFTHTDQVYTRTSLLARVRLEPWSARVVLPHEHTMKKAKADRLNLYRACATNLSPIMSLFEDPQGRMRRLLATYAEHPQIQFQDEEGVEHRLHPIQDQQHIALIQDFFSERQLYIADGHHRYETALAYRDELKEQRKELHPDDAANFTLMSLIDVDDPGMLVLPTHRLLTNLAPTMQAQLTGEQLKRYFTVEALATRASKDVTTHLEKAGQEQPAFVILTNEQALLLRLTEQGRHYMQTSEHSEAWKRLDVAIAQRLLLEETLGLRAEDMTAGTYVRYSHDADYVFTAVEKGEAQAALLLNSTPLRQVCEVAQADDRMPQKSTYLYPKLITGLVMNPLW
ncbi:phosphatase [Ktedonobacter sp. SOSP1-52]|nr:phosphatase [Ktedonobacter sp. SOSP1-52]